jgi:hypothetical protein
MADLEFTCSVVGKRPLIVAPTDIKGAPATLDGPAQIVLLMVNGAAAPDPAAASGPGDAASANQPYFVSSDVVGDVYEGEIDGDPDPAPGVVPAEVIKSTFRMTMVAAGAVALAPAVGTEVPKP